MTVYYQVIPKGERGQRPAYVGYASDIETIMRATEGLEDRFEIFDGVTYESGRDFLARRGNMTPEEKYEQANHGTPVAKEQVNHPAHYNQYKGLEVWDLVELMSFNLGNAIKYIARAGHKNPRTEIEDLRKAIAYIDREIARTEGRRKAVMDYGTLPAILTAQVSTYRGLAVYRICLERPEHLRAAVAYLEQEISIREGSKDS